MSGRSYISICADCNRLVGREICECYQKIDEWVNRGVHFKPCGEKAETYKLCGPTLFRGTYIKTKSNEWMRLIGNVRCVKINPRILYEKLDTLRIKLRKDTTLDLNLMAFRVVDQGVICAHDAADVNKVIMMLFLRSIVDEM